MRLRLILLAIGLLTIGGVLVLATPKALGFYYQVEGGQQLQSALKAFEDIPDLEIICAAAPRERSNQKAKIEKSVTLLERSLAHDSRNAQANLQLGRANCLLGNPTAAAEYYQAYIKIRPGNPLGHMGLGFANEALGEPALAVQSWKAADLNATYFLETGKRAFQARRYEDALRWFERSTWIGPEQAQPWLSLGEAYEQLGQAEDALHAFEIAWDIDRSLSTTALATSLEDRGDYPGAEKVLTQALEAFPDSAERLNWWRALGVALRAQNKLDLAADAYQTAIREFPSQSDLHTELGAIYYERGEGLEKAKQEMEIGIALNEQSGDGYFALARLLSQAGRHQEADRYFEEAIQRDPQDRWYMLARADNRRLSGDLPGAIELYRETIARFPEFSNAYFQLAFAYRQNNQLQEAVAAIESAITYMNPPIDSFFVRAGQIYRLAGLIDEAIVAYRQALKINPQNEMAKSGLQILGEK